MDGRLIRNPATGRWNVVTSDGDTLELTSGDNFFMKVDEFIKVRMEHNGNDYYIVPYKIEIKEETPAKCHP